MESLSGERGENLTCSRNNSQMAEMMYQLPQKVRLYLHAKKERSFIPIGV